MPMPRAFDSAGVENLTTSPRSSISPSSGVWTPERIFIRVLLPAPFSPTSPWISPGNSSKSTLSSAVAPPNRLVTPRNARIGPGLFCSDASIDGSVGRSAGSVAVVSAMISRLACPTLLSQLRLVLHVVVQPDVSGCILFVDRTAVGADKLRNAALGHVGAGDGQVAGPNRAAMDAAARVDDRGEQLVGQDRLGG